MEIQLSLNIIVYSSNMYECSMDQVLQRTQRINDVTRGGLDTFREMTS